MAGASEPSDLDAARRHKHPYRKAVFVTDAQAACVGAHGGGNGGIVVIGTGSIGWAELNGRQYRVGGWGWPISDEGSGAWLGCEALRRTLWAHDGRISWTALLSSLFEKFRSDPHAIVRWMTSALPRDFATFAPAIVEHASANDPTAVELLRLAGGHIDALAQRLVAFGVDRLSLAGSLAAAIEPWLQDATRHHLVAPLGDAVAGALQLARDAAESGQRSHCIEAPRVSAVRVKMEAEWQESPDAVRRQAHTLQAPLAELLRRIRGHPPNFVLTCARGSSAHSATFGKHLVERHLGIPVGAFAPNMATIYNQRLKLNGQLFLTVSQSGRSDDLIESAAMAKTAGALTAAIVNDTDSPLARSSDIVLPMAAGPELSVAATKSFVTSLSAWLHVVAGWAELDELRASIERLPDRLAAAMRLDWSTALKRCARRGAS